MGKAPAFQFYAADFIIGVINFTPAQVGGYVRLLALSWDKGPVPLDPDERASWIGAPRKQSDDIWRVVSKKWVETTEGFINERLEDQRAERAAFSAAQADRGRRSGDARKRTTVEPPFNQGATNERSTNPPLNSSVFSLQSSERERDARAPEADEVTNRGGAYTPVNPHSKPTNLVQNNRAHGQHRWCAWARPSLCVTQFIHGVCVDRLGGDKAAAEARLAAIYPTAITALGDRPAPDALRFWQGVMDAEVATAAKPAIYDASAGQRTRDELARQRGAVSVE